MKHIALIFILSVLIAGCSGTPVYNVKNEFVPTGIDNGQLSVGAVEKAILKAAQRRGWSPRIVKPGLIEASISVRTHRATIEIYYSESQYSIIYKSSENLNYNDGDIHRNYNNWVIKLSRTIQQEFGVNSQNY